MHSFQRWRDAIQLAPDENTVVGVMRDYVSAFPPAVIEALPPGCRPAIAEMDEDIQGAAVTLLRVELAYRGGPVGGRLLHEIAHTFAAASVRLSHIREQSNAPKKG
jgi:hypothetical protein